MRTMFGANLKGNGNITGLIKREIYRLHNADISIKITKSNKKDKKVDR